MVIVLISSSLSLTSHHMCSSPLQQSQHHATIKSISFCHRQLSLMQQSSLIYEQINNQLRPIIIIIIMIMMQQIVIVSSLPTATASQQLSRHHHCIAATINSLLYCHRNHHYHLHHATNLHRIIGVNSSIMCE